MCIRDRSDGVLDLDFEADASDRQSGGVLNLGEQQVECLNVGRRRALRQDEGVEVTSGAGDDLDDVGVGPGGRPVIDSDGCLLYTSRCV